jgi:hypothetical protein
MLASVRMLHDESHRHVGFQPGSNVAAPLPHECLERARITENQSVASSAVGGEGAGSHISISGTALITSMLIASSAPVTP